MKLKKKQVNINAMHKKNNYECLFCSKDLTTALGLQERKNCPIYNEQLKKNEPLVAFLICVDCMTNGNFPTKKDIDYIREGWNKGGFLWSNYRKIGQEDLLLALLIDWMAVNRIKVDFTSQGRVYLSNHRDEKGLVVNLNKWNVWQKSLQDKNKES